MDNTSSPDAEKVVQDISRQTEIPVVSKRPLFRSPIVVGLLFLIIVIAAFFAGGKFLGASSNDNKMVEVSVSPTASVSSPTLYPTDDWTTYVFKNTGISFKFPEPYVISYQSDEKDFSYVIFATTEKEKEGFATCMKGDDHECFLYPLSISINIGSKSEYKTLESFVESSPGSKVSTLRLTSVSGYRALQKEEKSGFGTKRSVFVDTNSEYIRIQGDATKDVEKNLSVFDQILKTFSFTDEAQTQLDSNSELDRLAKEAMMSYLAGFKSTSVADDQRISDYSIDSITKVHVKNRELRFLVIYSVKPAGNIATSFYWMTGSGGKIEGGWIKKEEGYVIAPLQNGKYVVQGIATGVGKDF